jgi:hypothetical protein
VVGVDARSASSTLRRSAMDCQLVALSGVPLFCLVGLSDEGST